MIYGRILSSCGYVKELKFLPKRGKLISLSLQHSPAVQVDDNGHFFPPAQLPTDTMFLGHLLGGLTISF